MSGEYEIDIRFSRVRKSKTRLPADEYKCSLQNEPCALERSDEKIKT